MDIVFGYKKSHKWFKVWLYQYWNWKAQLHSQDSEKCNCIFKLDQMLKMDMLVPVTLQILKRGLKCDILYK